MSNTNDQKDFLHLLHGVDFPAPRSRIISAAKDTGGLNGDVLLALDRIPDRTYETDRDLADEISRTSMATSVTGAAEPAAATAVSDAEKDLISTMADPRGGEFKPQQSKVQRAADAQRILARNHELVEGTATPDPEGAAETVGHMVSTDRSHVGHSSSND